jgi:hypothetical protein
MACLGMTHALHIRRQSIESLGTSNTLMSLGLVFYFFRLILLAFFMLILRVVGMTKRAILALAIFLDLLLFAGLLENNLQFHSPPQMLSM